MRRISYIEYHVHDNGRRKSARVLSWVMEWRSYPEMDMTMRLIDWMFEPTREDDEGYNSDGDDGFLFSSQIV